MEMFLNVYRGKYLPDFRVFQECLFVFKEIKYFLEEFFFEKSYQFTETYFPFSKGENIFQT